MRRATIACEAVNQAGPGGWNAASYVKVINAAIRVRFDVQNITKRNQYLKPNWWPEICLMDRSGLRAQ
jgi:hypothetical protein